MARLLFRLIGLSLILIIYLNCRSRAQEIDFQGMLNERLGTVVMVYYSVQSEEDRSSKVIAGLVMDAGSGQVLLANNAIPNWVPPSDIVEIKAYLPGNSEDDFEATYLGYDPVTQWHVIVVEEALRERLRSITDFESGELELGQRMWGIGIQPQSLNYIPYLLQSTKGIQLKLPWLVDVSQHEVAAPGGPVFDTEGRWIGMGLFALAQNYTIRMAGRTFPSSLTNENESSIVLLANEVMKHWERIEFDSGTAPSGWLGIVGMQPVENAVAEFLNLGDQGAIVITDIVEGSAAEAAGFEGRDIIVSVDGEPLSKFYPLNITVRDFEMTVSSLAPGETATFGVMRGEESLELTVTLLERPRQFRDAERVYYKELGFSIRPKLTSDGFSRRSYTREAEGAVVRFVRENSTAHSAGMQVGDWILEINGDAVPDYTTAQTLLEQVQETPAAEEYVVLVDRAGETQILRIKR